MKVTWGLQESSTVLCIEFLGHDEIKKTPRPEESGRRVRGPRRGLKSTSSPASPTKILQARRLLVVQGALPKPCQETSPEVCLNRHCTGEKLK